MTGGAPPGVVTYWCERTWSGPSDDVQPGVVIEITGDRITSVSAGHAAPPVGAIRLDGLTLPGSANAHSHAFHRALRGRTHGSSGTFWTWRDRMYEVAARLDPESYRALATATFAEMALAGITCVGEFHYLHHDPTGRPYADPNAMTEAIIDAAAAAGVRLTVLDACYLHGGVGVEPNEVQRRFSDGDVGRWVERVDGVKGGATVRIGAAIHSVRAVDPPSLAGVAEWADRAGAPLHAHVSEQPAENEQCLAAYGRTPTALLHDHGVLGERFTAVHATHLTDGDVALLADTGTACCLCPTTERDLADGIGPAAALRAGGVPMCLGSDSHAVIDLYEDARAIELDERLRSLRRGTHRPAELLGMATSAGYAALGWPDGGRIGVGALADLTTLRLDSVRLAGHDPADVVAALVFAATASDVHHVVVGGKVVVQDGAHVRIDVADALHRSITAVWQ